MAPPPPPPPPPRRPPDLMEELVEEVLLRFPPYDPASLVRAALVSRRWCRLISGGRFRRRFRELHRAAPMLGFVCNVLASARSDDSQDNARFVPTSSSCLPHADRLRCRALDAHHGRVLLYRQADLSWGKDCLDTLVVWDPITGEEMQLPSVPMERYYPFPVNAALLCAGGGACSGHLDCNRGPFVVVFVGIYKDGMVAYVYSSEAGAWSEPSIAQHPRDFLDLVPAAVVENAVYFLFGTTNRILKYDLGTRRMSLIDMPSTFTSYGHIILMTTDEGRLGLTRADDFKVYLWSMEVVSPQDDVVWRQDRVIELRHLLPADALLSSPAAVGFVNGHGVIFVGTEDGFYNIDLKSNKAMKVGKGIASMKQGGDLDIGLIVYGHKYYIVVPYTSFFFPALEAVSATAEPSAGGSGA